MNFTTLSGIQLAATQPSISSKKYFFNINGVIFELVGDKLNTVFESSVHKFLASIGKTGPRGLMRVSLELDPATVSNLIAFANTNAVIPTPQSISHEDWNGEGGITYHGTHEMWNGVRMD